MRVGGKHLLIPVGTLFSGLVEGHTAQAESVWVPVDLSLKATAVSRKQIPIGSFRKVSVNFRKSVYA